MQVVTRNGTLGETLGETLGATLGLAVLALLAANPAAATSLHHHHGHHRSHVAAFGNPLVQLASYEQPAEPGVGDSASDDADQADADQPDSDHIDLSTSAPGDIVQSGLASWYGNSWKGRRTSSGARFDPEAMTAASHVLPLGTRVLVTLEGTARSVLVTITDRQGCATRVIDLSMAAARRIGMLGMGTARVILRRA